MALASGCSVGQGRPVGSNRDPRFLDPAQRERSPPQTMCILPFLSVGHLGDGLPRSLIVALGMPCAAGLGPLRCPSGFEDGGLPSLELHGGGTDTRSKDERGNGFWAGASSVLSPGIPLGDRDCGQMELQLFQDVPVEGRVTFQEPRTVAQPEADLPPAAPRSPVTIPTSGPSPGPCLHLGGGGR